MAIRVMIADDHSIVREGIKLLIEQEDEFEVIGEAHNGTNCLKKLEKLKPDILLLDINMPKMNGLEVLQKIREKQIDVKVLVLTAHREPEYLLKASDIGINGYLLKESKSIELRRAIISIMKGENYVQSSLVPILRSRMTERDEENKKIEKLTRREMQVLKLIAVGMCNRDVAKEMNITERTVKNHVSNIFKKIGVTDRTQAAVFAIKNNLISVR